MNRRIFTLSFRNQNSQEISNESSFCSGMLIVGGIAWAEEKQTPPAKSNTASPAVESDSDVKSAKADDKLPTPGELIKN